MADDNIPDLFADSVNVSSGSYGITLTLYLSEPEPGMPVGNTPLGRKVGRVRMSSELARDLLRLMSEGLDALEKARNQGVKG